MTKEKEPSDSSWLPSIQTEKWSDKKISEEKFDGDDSLYNEDLIEKSPSMTQQQDGISPGFENLKQVAKTPWEEEVVTSPEIETTEEKKLP